MRLDWDSAITSIQTNWYMMIIGPSEAALCAPMPGTGIDRREGRRIDVSRVMTKGKFLLPATTSNVSGAASARDLKPWIVVFFLVLDKQCNGSAANISNVVEQTNDGNDWINLDNLGRYEILKRKTYKVTPMIGMQTAAAAAQQCGESFLFKLSHKFRKPLRVNFAAITPTNPGEVSTVVDNNVFLVSRIIDGPAASSWIAGTAAHWAVQSQCIFQDAT